MKLSESYRPASLSEIVGQPAVARLRTLAENPFPCCILCEGSPGTGKTSAALAFAAELGCKDDWSGLEKVRAVDMDIAWCRQYFDKELRLRPMAGVWRVLIIEELEATVSVAVQRFLKDALEFLRAKCIVIATSNGAGGLSKALLQRFDVLKFSGGKVFAHCAQDRLRWIWSEESDGAPIPAGFEAWGWDDGEFSMRLALAAIQGHLQGRMAAA